MTSARAVATIAPETGDRLWTGPYMLALLSALLFFSAFYLPLAALPKYLKDQLGSGTGEIGLVLGLFAVTAITPRPFIGRLVNGGITLAPMLICATIFMLANVFYAGATTIPLLIAVRLFHGGGMAGYTTAAPSLVAAITPAARRGEAMAYWGVANTLALAVCPALGLCARGALGLSDLLLGCGGGRRGGSARHRAAPAPQSSRDTAHPASARVAP